MWSPDGRQLFYRVLGERNHVVRITTQPSFAVGNPGEVIGSNGLRSRGIYEREYDIMPDGKRFIGVINQTQSELSQIQIVQNWLEELKRLVPTR
jgi:serine/threonine-protein kinase